jgi:hypothetical protein
MKNVSVSGSETKHDNDIRTQHSHTTLRADEIIDEPRNAEIDSHGDQLMFMDELDVTKDADRLGTPDLLRGNSPLLFAALSQHSAPLAAFLLWSHRAPERRASGAYETEYLAQLAEGKPSQGWLRRTIRAIARYFGDKTHVEADVYDQEEVRRVHDAHGSIVSLDETRSRKIAARQYRDTHVRTQRSRRA